MKVKTIPSAWMRRDGRRFDCGPYMSGALEAKIRLEELECRKDRLADLTAGHAGGIYNGPQFVRNFVDDPEHGVPFLGTSSMLRADLSDLPLLRKRDAVSAKLSYLRVAPGMTLISCSGTIGRMVYVRPDMAGMWSNQDILKVVPNERVPAGYIYAFLSSKFGVPLVTSGTYGAIIQHIEPGHIAELPVPRLGDEVEREAHRLVEEAARLRATATTELSNVAAAFDALLPTAGTSKQTPRITTVSSSQIQTRFDAQYHDPDVQRVRNALKGKRHTTIGDFCSTVFLPGIFKRIHIDDPAHGAPYFTGASLFWLEPIPKGILSRRTKLYDDVELHADTILVQAFGQDGGITGRAVWVGRHLDRATSTHMLCRLRTSERARTAYLFGFLNSKAAQTQIRVLTYGGSIPHFDEAGISTVVVPLLGDDVHVDAIGKRVLRALDGRDDALALERQARALVERAIEEAA
ncbi:MAG: hypothetical protein KC766_40055 [Myxococcales bacterium]|nr:hypothetical protein [Myxococcales bacterium]